MRSGLPSRQARAQRSALTLAVAEMQPAKTPVRASSSTASVEGNTSTIEPRTAPGGRGEVDFQLAGPAVAFTEFVYSEGAPVLVEDTAQHRAELVGIVAVGHIGDEAQPAALAGHQQPVGQARLGPLGPGAEIG